MWQGYFRKMSKEDIKKEIRSCKKELKQLDDPKFVKKYIQNIKDSLMETIKELEEELKED